MIETLYYATKKWAYTRRGQFTSILLSLLMNYFLLKVLSQGDEKGFQKSVKILGFQMKITVSLVREYQDYLSDCGSDVYIVLIHLQRLV